MLSQGVTNLSVLCEPAIEDPCRVLNAELGDSRGAIRLCACVSMKLFDKAGIVCTGVRVRKRPRGQHVPVYMLVLELLCLCVKLNLRELCMRFLDRVRICLFMVHVTKTSCIGAAHCPACSLTPFARRWPVRAFNVWHADVHREPSDRRDLWPQVCQRYLI